MRKEQKETVKACFIEQSKKKKKKRGFFKLGPYSVTDVPIYTRTII